MESPRKRRRLSDEAYITTGSNAEYDATELRQPTTPNRQASYLSPTKSSLARSHLNVLAKSPKRGSMTEPRGKLLRRELMGSKKGAGPTAAVPKSAPRPSSTAQNGVSEGPSKALANKDGFAEAIANSFQTTQPEEQSIPLDQPSRVTRSPLRTRQPPSTLTEIHSNNHKSPTPTFDSLPTPKLVSGQMAPVRQPSEARNEPELPPTPVQLGLGAVPDRPRGLASSSSIGSRSGSGRHRRRVRDNNEPAITSSPLKPKNNRPISPIDFSDIEEIDVEAPEEAPESDIQGPEHQIRMQTNDQSDKFGNLDLSDLPAELQQKLTERESLIIEMAKLQRDLAVLESLSLQTDKGIDLTMNEETISLLSPGSENENLQSPQSHPSFVKNPSAYLQLFQPPNVLLEHETSTKQVQKRPKIFHKLQLNPMTTWSQELLSLCLDVEIDAEDAQINNIIHTKSSKLWGNSNLQNWIQERLLSRLHKFDAGGIVWGAGQYFEACVERAKVLRYLDMRYNYENNAEQPQATIKRDGLTNKDIAQLSRYIHESQLILSPRETEDPTMTRLSQSRSKTMKIMITYEIRLTWTGTTTTQMEMCITGVGAKAAQHMKEVFMKLLSAQGLLMAVEGIWSLLNWDTEPNGVKAPNRQPVKLRK